MGGKVAIVILNWNGQKLLKQFLPSVLKHTPISDVYKIIVADNASTDASVDYLHKEFPSVEVLTLTENFGFAEGYNQALKQIGAEYFVLLNSDVEVTSGWLDPLIKYLEKNQDVSIVQPKILYQRKKTKFEYAGASGGFIDKLGFPFCRGRIFDTIEKDFGQYNATSDVFWASGACMMVRSKDFLENGGFDPKFFAHMEEIDFCWRLKARGKRVVCVPQSVVYHVGGATLTPDSEFKIYLNFRNNMLMLFKNIDQRLLNSTLRKRMFYNLIAAFKFLLSGSVTNYKAVLKAHKDFKKMKSEYVEIRKENIEKTISFAIPEIYQGNIVLDYYIRGKKRFDELIFGQK